MESTPREKLVNWWTNNYKDAVLVIGVTLIAIISFCAGYLSNIPATPPISITQSSNLPQMTAFVANSASSSVLTANTPILSQNKGIIVASKNGKYYHWPWSTWGKQIKPANQIWYNSESEAKAAGYKPASDFLKNAPAGYIAK